MLIEFSGLPRSGKSSHIDILRDYFSRQDYQVRTIGEAAKQCPFSKKENRVEFASWIANKALNSVMETGLTVPRNTIVLQDRGLFDSMAFINLLYLDNFIDVSTRQRFLNFFASEIWIRHIDLILYFKISPNLSLARDLARRSLEINGIHSSPAFITNESSLSKLATSYEFIIDQYHSLFSKRLVVIDFEKKEEKTTTLEKSIVARAKLIKIKYDELNVKGT